MRPCSLKFSSDMTDSHIHMPTYPHGDMLRQAGRHMPTYPHDNYLIMLGDGDARRGATLSDARRNARGNCYGEGFQTTNLLCVQGEEHGNTPLDDRVLWREGLP